MVASGEAPPKPCLASYNSIHSIRFSRFPAGLLARRALRVPAWRKIEYYLARSAVSRTFFRKFSPAVPRAAGRLSPSGLGPFAATSSVLYAPPARRGRETLPRTGCRQLQRGKAEGAEGIPGGREPLARRFAPPRMRGRPAAPTLRLGPYMETPQRPGPCAPRPSGAFDSIAYIQLPIYK